MQSPGGNSGAFVFGFDQAATLVSLKIGTCAANAIVASQQSFIHRMFNIG
jgi:hypothetical protein